MADIVTSRVFVDGEKGITAQKLNDIQGQAVIQPEFYTTKPASSTLDPTDTLLEVKGSGAYAKIAGSQLISSVSSQVDATPQIWSVRLRSFNSLGNANMECDQFRNGVIADHAGQRIIDRWGGGRAAGATLRCSGQSVVNPGNAMLIPGTSFAISANYLRITLTTAQASLAAGDYYYVNQQVEGPMWRELSVDVHSVSILCRSSVANLQFGLSLRDPGTTRSLTKLCTLGAANTVTLISLANLPVWSSSGNFVLTPGSLGYYLAITLAAGSTFMSPANDTWQNGNFLGAQGQMNFAGQAVNSTFDLMVIQHEPGPVCSQLMDLPFDQNLTACERYFQKSYDLAVKSGTVTNSGTVMIYAPAAQHPITPIFYKRRMAKIPTVTGYSPNTGASGVVRDITGTTDRTISAVNFPGEAMFNGFTTTTQNAGLAQYSYHYTADTGF